MEKNKIQTPTPWPPENFRRRSVRVLKLHREFFLTKKGDINPQKNSETPPWPPGGRV
jgi:hypothetical protein